MPPKVIRSPTATRSRSATAASTSDAASDEESSASKPAQLVMTEAQLAALVESITRSQAETNRQLVESIIASGRVTPSSSSAVTPTAVTGSVAAPARQGSFAKCSARFRGGAANDDDVLEAFIDSVEVYRECTNITDEHALRGLPMLLEGDAAVWWQGVKPTTTTWQGAIDGLRAMFGVPRPAHKVFRDVFAKEQRDGEKSDVFINRVRASLAKLPYKLLEETQIDIVYGLLSLNIRERLPRKECVTLSDLVSRARDIVVPHNPQPRHTHSNPKSSNDQPSVKKDHTNSTVLRCYGCGQPGVIKSKCTTCKTSVSSVGTNKVLFQGVEIYSSERSDVTRAIVEVSAAGRRGVAVLDSGATHSLASSGLYTILRDSGVQFTESQYNFGLADGSKHVSQVLCCNTSIELEGRQIPVSFTVLPNADNKTLLGIDFMKEAGIIIDIARASWSFSDTSNVLHPFVLKYDLSCDAELMQSDAVGVALRDDEGLKLTADQRVQLNRLLEEHVEVFAENGPATDFALHCIKVKENQQPIACPPYRLSPRKKDLLNKELQKLLENDVIEECESPWAANVVLVNKKDGGVRLCVDYRRLNAVTEPDCYPLPRMEDILHAAKTSNYMTTLDLRSGYFQCLVKPEDRDKTTFTSPLGTFRFKRMPMGLRNSGATFQRLIDRFKSNLKCKDREGGSEVMREVHLLAYLDDLIILSDDFTQHLDDLEAVFERLKMFNLRVHRQKSVLARDSVRFLGHVIVPGGLQVDPEKVDAIVSLPPPRNLKHLMSFIQTTSWFRRFIPNYADEARPLTSLLKKDVAWRWAEPQQQSFEKLKAQLVSAPILRQADETKPYVLRTDSSGYCLGAVLLQGEAVDERPIEYASRLLTPAEKNYNTTEREALAVVWAVTKFRGYIEGAEVLVKSDHQPLKWLMNLKSPSGRLARWALTLQEYNLRIDYTPGKANVVADMLSRPPCAEEPNCDLCYTTIDVPTRKPGDIRENQLADPEVKKIVDDLESNEPFKARVWANRGYVISDGILYRYAPDSEEAESPCLVVPAHERAHVLRELHDAPTAGHFGAERTLLRVAERHYWPGMRTFVSDYVKSCVPCQRYKVDTRKPAGLLQTPATTRRFEVVSVDLFGPLPETVNRNKWILIVEDVCSRWVELFPLQNATSMECAKLLIDEIFFRYGVPRRMTSDNGVQFISEVMQQACHAMGVTQDLTPLYHPESNPIERKNRDLKPQLAILVGQDHASWDAHLSAIRFAMNSAVTASTGFTPAYLTFGRELRTPLDAVTDMRAILEADNFVPSVTPYLKRIANALLQARDVHEKAQQQQKKYADEGRRDVPPYEVGDLVLLKTEGQNSAARGQTPKFIPRRDGPYRVHEACSPVSYILVDPSSEEPIGKYHCSKLTPFVGHIQAPMRPKRRRGRPRKNRSDVSASLAPVVG